MLVDCASATDGHPITVAVSNNHLLDAFRGSQCRPMMPCPSRRVVHPAVFILVRQFD
jgi:hypothetical protein